MSTTVTEKTRDYIGFTLDCKALGNLIAQDPSALTELIEGIKAAQASERVPLTTKLGAANLGGDGDAADWHGLFVSTVRDVAPGSAGLFYRNSTSGTRDGKGPRIQMRLRRQPKRQEANVAQTPGQVLTSEETKAIQALANSNPAFAAMLNAAGAAPTQAPDDLAGIAAKLA